MSGTWEVEIEIPEDATPEEEEALIQAAVNKKIDDDIDDVLGGLPASNHHR